MFYIYLLLGIVFVFSILYYRKNVRLSHQFKERATLRAQYRFQHMENVEHESGKSKNGALILTVERLNFDTRNIVIKEVTLDHSCYHISLDQLIMISFPADSVTAYEASVRFRVRGSLSKAGVLSDRQALISGYITSDLSGRIPFRLRVPVEKFEAEDAPVDAQVSASKGDLGRQPNFG
ncbi:hypothetical protein [Sphingobacterium sp. ML3W]|uniref:hypothetical protein n=1 Tax=Sphingobacterium sp. ML3W TaxID=1538644 RepID=UPI00118591A3|nr:hypothetical protein [Sphingobacterium sp. ML3W]